LPAASSGWTRARAAKTRKIKQSNKATMDAAMDGLGQQAEARGVVVERGQNEQQHGTSQAARGSSGRNCISGSSSASSFCRSAGRCESAIRLGHGLDPEPARHSRSQGPGSHIQRPQMAGSSGVPAARAGSAASLQPARLPCRISRRPDAAGMPRPAAPSPCGSPCPWRGRIERGPCLVAPQRLGDLITRSASILATSPTGHRPRAS
jgi:hypothetical protein